MSITLQNFVQVSQGARVKPIDAIIPGGIQLMNQGGFAVRLSWMQIAIVVITLDHPGHVHLAGDARPRSAGPCAPASRT